MQDLTGKSTGGSLTAAEWNEVPQEMQNIIVDLGIALSLGDLDQMGKAISMMVAAADFYTASGTDTITLTKVGNKQAPPAYLTGMRIRFRPASTNTGAVTVNVNAIGAKSLKRENGAALVAGNLATTRDVEARYDGTDFLMQESTLGNPVLQLGRGYIDGLIMSLGSDPDEDIDFSIGQCRDADNSANIINGAVIGKSITAVATTGGTSGSPTGGYPTGIAALAEGWYHFFVITDGISITGGFDLSLTAANLIDDHTGGGGADLSTYIYYRRLGSVYVDSALDILPFNQFGDHFLWNPLSPTEEFIASTDLSGGVLMPMTYVPPDVRVDVDFVAYVNNDLLFVVYSPEGDASLVPDFDGITYGTVDMTNFRRTEHTKFFSRMMTNTNQELKIKADATNGTSVAGQVHGYWDVRGKE